MLVFVTHFLFPSRFDGSLNPSSLLDDKSHLDATRDMYKAYEYGGSYGYQGEGEWEERGEELPFLFEYDQYNDEYDDTYDSHNVGAADQVSADDLFTVKRYVRVVCTACCVYTGIIDCPLGVIYDLVKPHCTADLNFILCIINKQFSLKHLSNLYITSEHWRL